ncbi:MAG: peptidylprolyl isomerase [Actinobacteria bacterium]|nr:peptidylprolyl isomerase [Actinomycetota bacterium]
MNRFRSVLVFLVAVAGSAALLGACSVVNPPALTVGSYSLSRDDFLAEMTKITQSGVLSGQDQAGAASSPGSTMPASFSTANTATVLNVHAQSQIAKQVLAQKGISVTGEDTNRFLQKTAQDLAAQGQQVTAAQLEQELASLDPLQRENVDSQIALSALGRALVSDAEVQQRAQADYDANQEKLSQTCLSFIHASAGAPPSAQSASAPAQPTEADYAAAQAKMQAAKVKIDGGAAFADVAKTDSDDQQTAAKGGAVGCLTASQMQQLPPAIADIVTQLAVNGVSDPTRLERDGYYLFSVTRRGIPAFSEVQQNLEGNARTTLEQERAKQAITDAAKSVAVTVDPLFGRWDANQVQVVAPAGAQQPSTSLPGLGAGGAPGEPTAPSGVPSGPSAP